MMKLTDCTRENPVGLIVLSSAEVLELQEIFKAVQKVTTIQPLRRELDEAVNALEAELDRRASKRAYPSLNHFVSAIKNANMFDGFDWHFVQIGEKVYEI